MKVFEFDPVTGKRGAQIDEIERPTGTSNLEGRTCTLPTQPGAEWRVVTEVQKRDGVRIMWPRPVCFCLGKMSAGEDSSWWWCAYLPS